VATRLLRPILAAASSLGLDGARWAARAGVGELRGGVDEHITLGQYLGLWDAALAEGRRDLPLLAATALGTDSFGVIGFSCMTSPTVGAAFLHLARYYRILNSAGQWTREDDARGRISLTFELDAERSPARDCAVELALAEVVHFARLIAARPVPLVEARLPHSAPDDVSGYRRIFQAPLRWRAPRAALVLERSAFETPLLRADPHLLAYFERQADALAAQHAGDEPMSVEVRRLVMQALPSGPPTVSLVARRLAVSERSLRRRLCEEGTSFQALLEDTRRELAQRYLGDPKLTVSEIAFLCGFSDLSPFQRAFRRWTGTTPRQARAKRASVGGAK
jgi:AraC-like DNA-binding protein